MQHSQLTPVLAFLLIPCFHAVSQNDDDLLTNAETNEVVLVLDTGEEIEGELLSVNDHTLVISAADKFSDAKRATINVVEHEKIHTVTMRGRSNVHIGTGAGVVLGVFAAALFVDLEDHEISFEDTGEQILVGAFERPRTFMAFALGGAVLGAVVGTIYSESDQELISRTNRDFSALKPFTRFPSDESGNLWP